MDASDIYAELLTLTTQEQQQWLERIRREDPVLADDLADMLDMSTTELTQHGGLFFSHNLETGPSPYIGKQVMGFTLTRLLSDSGATGLVFQAEQTIQSTQNDEQCSHYAAVKILRDSAFSQAEKDALFYRETSNLIALNHAKICQLYGVSNIDDTPCIVTEFIDGKQLDVCISEDNPTRIQRLKIYRQILQGMAYAHSRGLYHGDLKPQNILIDTQGNVKIIDLGFARQFSADNADISALEQHYIYAFSRHWSAPEQQSGVWYKSRSDVFSLGILLFYLLHQALPNREGFSVDPTNYAAVSQAAGMCVESAAIVAKATHPDPQQRYREADELLADVDRWYNGKPVLAYSRTYWYRARKTITRHPLMSGISAALSLALIVGGVNMIRQHLALVAEKATSQEVIDQLSDTLLYSRPELSHTFTSPSLDEVYQHAAKRWDTQQHNLTPAARYQTALLYLQGLMSLYQLDAASTLLQQLRQAVPADLLSTAQRDQLDIIALQILQQQDMRKTVCYSSTLSDPERATTCPSIPFAEQLLAQHHFTDTNDLSALKVIIAALNVYGLDPDLLQSNRIGMTHTISRLLSANNDRWDELSLDDQIALHAFFTQPQGVNDNFALQDADKKHLSLMPQQWLSRPLSVAKKYQILEQAEMVAYNLGQNTLGEAYQREKKDMLGKELTMNPMRLSYAPLEQLNQKDYHANKAALAAMEQAIIAGYRDNMSYAFNAINSLASAHLFIGDLEGAKASLSLPLSPKLLAGSVHINMFSTYPSEMILSIWYRNWTRFNRSYEKYQTLIETQQQSTGDPLYDTYFQLFNTLLTTPPEAIDYPALTKRFLAPYSGNYSGELYLLYALAITNHTDQAKQHFAQLIESPSVDMFLSTAYDPAPAWHDAIMLYARLLSHHGYPERAEQLLTARLNAYPGSNDLHSTLLRLALAETYQIQGKKAKSLALWQQIAPLQDSFRFRSDLRAISDSLIKLEKSEKTQTDKPI
ncbi:serine/threonine protein kinase [Photobacterium nomapromontoriensis]|uniref:serine/threonine protein kinase n=1 Tax=Photobacterium nomapromontoriensis TaxID=2910237 RepID=UPI003D0CFDA8